MLTDTLIIGGGLSGLALAAKLAAQGRDFLLVEARDRLGGRILTVREGAAHFDLGPTWFWPGQPRIAALTERLGLSRFDQFCQGDVIFENEQGRVHRGRGYASMQGAWRLEGGLGALIAALENEVPAQRRRVSTTIRMLTRAAPGIIATSEDGVSIQARRVVLALPPRMAVRMSFTPTLPIAALTELEGIATWMAGHAKAVAVYDRPFWLEAGLSGDAMSRHGPVVEIHDASPASGGPYALFGFIGVPPRARSDQQALRRQIQAQLIRLFGPEAATPNILCLKDWAYDRLTATELDAQAPHVNSRYGLPRVLNGLWDGDLILAGTEVAPKFGGYLEGALEASELALANLGHIES
ncbi:FAD dependent oxidoreductase family protein [Hydrogenophaga sp. RAC07]|uniref:flavin monoamine oxidase family protein n=1 Tax=Hydrogenophaga sp. RAC07 TaxID=1842537 RepID=UPI00083D84F7|nr:FAD-dependent oxidoreductase [Hydrogenophaga sp. RAC07]AOF87833.1 FAD dependent oxidoreductase family protein [Hydrogenophaga sp. RAC07]MDP3165062.1 FAD-dependent oxidoreductase [Hydrogenophaga sp.]